MDKQSERRLTTYTIKDQQVWNMYQKALALVWTPKEIAITKDKEQMKQVLTKAEQHIIKYIHAFFASADGIININAAGRFKKDFEDSLEINYFYDFQIMIENIHAEVYSIILFELVPDIQERDKLLNGFKTIPVIEQICAFMFKYIEADLPVSHRLFAMACAEGIMFTGCFCVIYWLAGRGLMPGLAHANELIARDEAIHTFFSLLLLDRHGIDHKVAHQICDEAVTIAIDFMKEAIIEPMEGMNIGLMSAYIKHTADNLLGLIGIQPLYKVRHIFDFMEQINMANKTAFFERRVSEYHKAIEQDTIDFETVEDF